MVFCGGFVCFEVFFGVFGFVFYFRSVLAKKFKVGKDLSNNIHIKHLKKEGNTFARYFKGISEFYVQQAINLFSQRLSLKFLNRRTQKP